MSTSLLVLERNIAKAGFGYATGAPTSGRLGDVFPRFAMHNLADGISFDSILQSQFIDWRALCKRFANSLNLLVCEFGRSVCFAFQSAPRPLFLKACITFWVNKSRRSFAFSNTPFSHHIGAVLFISRQKQMSRIYAPPVTNITNWIQCITTVAYNPTLRDRPIVQLPREAMSTYGATDRDCKITITLSRCACPKPAPIRLINLLDFIPKTLFKGWSLMSYNKPYRTTFDVSSCSVVEFCKTGFLTTTTLTKAEGYDRMRLHLKSPNQIWGAMLRGALNAAGASCWPDYSTSNAGGQA